METIRSSETSVHTKSTPRHIPENGILPSNLYENLKSYNNQFSFPGNAVKINRVKKSMYNAFAPILFYSVRPKRRSPQRFFSSVTGHLQKMLNPAMMKSL
jgi:hypothetical protein